MLKAIFIQSGQSVSQFVSGDPVFSIPSIHQGFGNVDLSSVLYFANEKAEKLNNRSSLFIVNNESLKNGDYKLYCFRALGPSFKVSLVWTDAPSENPLFQLVNNIDLSVIETNSFVKSHVLHIGNNMSSDEWDMLNNVEQVLIRNLDQRHFSDILIQISGTNIPTNNQPFSLVVNGDFLRTEKCESSFYCPNDCLGRGECIKGRCKCFSFFYGVDCSLGMLIYIHSHLLIFRLESMKLYPRTSSSDVVIPHGHWKFFHLNEQGSSNGKQVHVSVTIELKYSTGSVVAFGSVNRLPDFSSYSSFISLDQSSWKGKLTFNNTENVPKNYTIGIFGLCCTDPIVTLQYLSELQSVPTSFGKFVCFFIICNAL